MLDLPSPLVRERLELRPLEVADAKELYAAIDANREHLRRWLPWLDRSRSVSDVESFIEQGVSELSDDRAVRFCIRYDNRICGAIGLHAIDWSNRSTSIGYWLDASVQGRGIMTDCCAHVVAYVFDILELHRVVIRCAVDNGRSRAIPQRLGFQEEGVARDSEWLYDRFQNMVTYALLRTDEPQIFRRSLVVE